MFGQMTAGSWIYIGTQGILQGTYQTFCAAGEVHFGSPDLVRADGADGGPRRHGRRAAARGDDGGRGDPLRRGRPALDRPAARDALRRRAGRTRSTTPSRGCARPPRSGGPCRWRCSANAADVFPELVARGEHFDLVTDQTAAHDPLTGYVPAEVPFEEAAALRARDPEALPRARLAVDRGARPGDVRVRPDGLLCFRLWQQPARGGLCRWPERRRSHTRASSRPISGRSSAAGSDRSGGRCCRVTRPTSTAIDRELQALFPDDVLLQRWLAMAPEKVAFQGLPARICWLGYGDRAQGRARDQRARPRRARVSAPVVIGRDHLDSGSVASPYRETEAMRDGSDAIADWPILNALLNTAAGATWVCVHHGGGVGIGNSIHAGMVVLADGTRRCGRAARARARRRSRHRGHAPRRRRLRGGARRRSGRRTRPSERAARSTRDRRLLIRDLAQVATPGGAERRCAGAGCVRVDVVERRVRPLRRRA